MILRKALCSTVLVITVILVETKYYNNILQPNKIVNLQFSHLPSNKIPSKIQLINKLHHN